MKKTYRVFGFIGLCFFLASCAGSYNEIPLPMTDPGNDGGENDPDLLTSGDEVRITVIDGRVIKGVFARYQDESLVIRNVRIEGVRKIHYPRSTQLE